jgi:exonuclease III
VSAGSIKEPDNRDPKSWVEVASRIEAFWNVRGLNKEGHLQCLADFVKDNYIDFVGLQETKKENFEESFLSYIHKDFRWHVLPAKGTS